jgi:hypothetical protein
MEFFIHKRIISVVKMVEFINNRMSYVTLSGWYDTVLNVCAPAEDKSDDMKDSFYEELEHVLDIVSVPEVPHENFVRRFQCKSREGKYFQE